MILPEKIEFRPYVLSRYANGGHCQEFINLRYGIRAKIEKKDHDSNWTRTFTSDLIPDKEFPTYEALREELIKNTTEQRR